MANGTGGDEADKEVESGFMLTKMITQLKYFDTKIAELEVQCNRKGRYLPPHAQKKFKDSDNQSY